MQAENKQAAIEGCKEDVRSDLHLSMDILTFTDLSVTRDTYLGHRHLWDVDGYVNETEFSCVSIKIKDGIWNPLDEGNPDITIGGVDYTYGG